MSSYGSTTGSQHPPALLEWTRILLFPTLINIEYIQAISKLYIHFGRISSPSSSSSSRFFPTPPVYPPSVPSEAITLWQGTMMEIGFLPFAFLATDHNRLIRKRLRFELIDPAKHTADNEDRRRQEVP